MKVFTPLEFFLLLLVCFVVLQPGNKIYFLWSLFNGTSEVDEVE